MKKPTLDTLAAQVGVSRQTISNVLNKPEKVSPQTRQRVLAAIEAAGYRPSNAARALRTQRTHTLAMRLSNAGDGINGAVMDGFLHALVTAAGLRGYRITLFTAADDSAELDIIREFRDSKAIDGVILTDTHAGDQRPNAIHDLRLPVVAFGRPWDREGEHDWVDVDGAAGVAQATRRLLDDGHTPVGFIGWPDDTGVGADRYAGWARATGYSADQQRRYSTRQLDSPVAGGEAMAKLLDEGVTAVVCASDSLAIGAFGRLRDKGVAGHVVGFDDTPVARMIGLSSLRQPVHEVAKHVVETLLGRISDPEGEPRHILLPPTLQARTVASTS
ncbi:LacI family DNA-binding transcriptional regulator [Tessaracoccus lubricantis]|uniref:LacI family DNA-binding transcriptional regulator n=1 Tax=Tessaracoccus lubricantis TaxID=545543 RepID=A0ABP9F8Q8_9ACTN